MQRVSDDRDVAVAVRCPASSVASIRVGVTGVEGLDGASAVVLGTATRDAVSEPGCGAAAAAAEPGSMGGARWTRGAGADAAGGAATGDSDAAPVAAGSCSAIGGTGAGGPAPGGDWVAGVANPA